MSVSLNVWVRRGRVPLMTALLVAALPATLAASVAMPTIGAAAPVASGVITTTAGTGRVGYSGDGGSALAAMLSYPSGAVQAPDGGVLIVDFGNNVIRRSAPDASIATVAGMAGPAGFAGDGGQAKSARLAQPTAVSPTTDGGFLIADGANNRVRKVSVKGIISTVAGSGATCANPASTCGDGGTAVAAQLNGPSAVASTSDGGFLITEAQANKVRKVSASGIISRVVGTGVACSSPTSTCGDGGTAAAGQLNGPKAIAVAQDGSWFISDSNDNRIRKVSTTGTITTAAGNGVAGSYGDGVSATSANLNSPGGVAVAPDGSIVVADSYSHLVRVVRAGVIRTVAGMADSACTTPTTDTCGDGGPGRTARLNDPAGVSVTTDGLVLVADQGDQRVRRIDTGLGGSPTIWVQNHRLVNGTGRAVQLRGVNRAAFESRCTWDTSGGVADGPVDLASVTAMMSWKINTVRLPLNEDCWLGVNGLPLGGTASAYRTAVRAYVNLLRSNGLYVVPDIQATAPGAQRSTEIDYMPDASHAPAFWASVATVFKGDHGLIFDPVNEVAMASWNDPHPSPAGQWNCWLHGCTLDSIYAGAPRYAAAGLQTLVNTIRTAGATQPVLLGGLSYNSDLTQLSAYLPNDAQHQLVASAHVYDFAEGNAVDAMFTDQLEPISRQIPVILGELGERYCDSSTAAYTSHVLSLINGQETRGNLFGVLGWTWNASTAESTGWRCPTGPYGDGGPLLIRGYDGTPTVMGNVLRTWIASRPG